MLEEKLISNKVSRRNFLKKSKNIALGSLLFPNLVEEIFAQILEYKEAKVNEKIRQKHLNQFLNSKRDSFPYINKLTYEQDPKMFFIMKSLERKGKGISIIYINSEELRRSYAYVIHNLSEFGKKQKSEVYVFPKTYELKKDEFEIIIFHENEHCKDIFKGIELNKESFDASKLNPYVLQEIMDLRAGYGDMENILGKMGQAENLEAKVFFQKVISFPFIQKRENEYVNSYMNLKRMLEKSQLSPYETYVVKKHLLHFGKWIVSGSRYKE